MGGGGQNVISWGAQGGTGGACMLKKALTRGGTDTV